MTTLPRGVMLTEAEPVCLRRQAHSAVQELQTAVRERPGVLLTDGCTATLARLYELGPPAGVATAKRRLAEFATAAGPQGISLGA